jgi:hypothetical protein
MQDTIILFICGLRFDMSVISMFLGIFIIFLFVPFAQKSAKFFKFCALFMTISVAVMILILSVVFFYFPEVNRHMTEELVMTLEDKEFIIRYSLRYYWWVLVLIFSVVALTVVKVFKYINKKFNPQPVSLLKNVIIFLSVFFLLF